MRLLPQLIRTQRRGLFLPGVASNYASTPDSAAASITGDIDVRIWMRPKYAVPAAIQTVISKWDAAGCYMIRQYLDGTINVLISRDGSEALGMLSNAPLPFPDNTPGWLRWTRVAATDVNAFYYSNNGVQWTAMGAAVAHGTPGNLFDNGDSLLIGVQSAIALPYAGSIYYVEWRNGIDGPVVVKFDPQKAQNNARSFVSSTGETWTINSTGNRPAKITAFDYKA